MNAISPYPSRLSNRDEEELYRAAEKLVQLRNFHKRDSQTDKVERTAKRRWLRDLANYDLGYKKRIRREPIAAAVLKTAS